MLPAICTLELFTERIPQPVEERGAPNLPGGARTASGSLSLVRFNLPPSSLFPQSSREGSIQADGELSCCAEWRAAVPHTGCFPLRRKDRRSPGGLVRIKWGRPEKNSSDHLNQREGGGGGEAAAARKKDELRGPEKQEMRASRNRPGRIARGDGEEDSPDRNPPVRSTAVRTRLL